MSLLRGQWTTESGVSWDGDTLVLDITQGNLAYKERWSLSDGGKTANRTANDFEDAAQAQGTSLATSGDVVIQGPSLAYFPLPSPSFPATPPYFLRVSSVADFAAAMSNTNIGPVTGQLFYFGHGGVDRL